MTFPFLHYKRGPLLSTRIGTSFYILLINWPIFDKYILLTAEDRFLVRINALLNGRVLSVQIYQKKYLQIPWAIHGVFQNRTD